MFRVLSPFPNGGNEVLSTVILKPDFEDWWLQNLKEAMVPLSLFGGESPDWDHPGLNVKWERSDLYAIKLLIFGSMIFLQHVLLH